MPLQRQQIDVPVGSGLSQKSDARYAEVGEAIQMINCVRLKDRAVRKRYGHTAISKTRQDLSTISSAVAGGSVRGIPWMADARANMLVLDEQTGKWDAVSGVSEIEVLDRIQVMSTASATNTPVLDVDVAYGSGLLAVAWSTVDVNANQSVSVNVINLVTGAIAFSFHTGAGNFWAPRIFVCGTTLILTHAKAGVGVQARKLDLTNPGVGFGAATTILSGGVQNFSSGVYDACAMAGDPTRFAACYQAAAAAGSGAGNLQTITFSASTLAPLVTKNFDNTILSVKAIALRCTSGEQFVAAYHGSAVGTNNVQTRVGGTTDAGGTLTTAIVFDWTLASITTPPGRVAVERVSATDVVATWSAAVANAALSTQGFFAQQVHSGATTGQLQFTPVVGVWSRPATTATGVYQMVLTPSMAQGTIMLLAHDWWGDTVTPTPQASRCVATVSPRLTKAAPAFWTVAGGAGITAQSLQCSALVPVTGIGVSVLAGVIVANTATNQVAIYVELFDVQGVGKYQCAELGQVAALAAGTPQVMDGFGATELGFEWYPEGIVATPAGGGGSIANGTYSYIAIYAWYDRAGNIMRSATSPPVSATVAGGPGSVALSAIPQIAFSQGPSASSRSNWVEIYRTANGGSIYYLVASGKSIASLQCEAAIGTGNAISALLTFTDTASDASITSNADIYTTGGVLDNFNPPAARIAVTHRNRWWLGGGDDPRALWPSKALTDGESSGFNEAFNFLLDGALRAAASMDDKLVLFVQRGSTYGIEYITGDGPTDLGTQSDWTPPQQVPSGVGAVDQRCVCAGPFGVLFRSNVGGPNGTGGIFLLSRDLQVSYAGRGVEDTLAAFPVVTSMVLHPTAGRVYVTCVPTDTGFSTGVRLVWDYLQGGAWSLDQIADPDTAQPLAGARHAWVATSASQGPSYYWVTSAGRVYRETIGVGANSYTDAGTWVSMTYSTAWIKPSMNGFARFWRVYVSGDSLDPCDVTTTLIFDFQPQGIISYKEIASWTALQIFAFDRAPQIDVWMTPGNQKAKAIQVTVSDGPPTGVASVTGQGMSLAGFSFELGVDGRAYPNLPPGQRA